jgi:hypothetical protein
MPDVVVAGTKAAVDGAGANIDTPDDGDDFNGERRRTRKLCRFMNINELSPTSTAFFARDGDGGTMKLSSAMCITLDTPNSLILSTRLRYAFSGR